MYLHTSVPLGQAELPSAYGTPCLQDDVKERVEAALLSDTVSKNLDQFFFRSPRASRLASNLDQAPVRAGDRRELSHRQAHPHDHPRGRCRRDR